ncbi:MAG: mercury methylation corrinoid protein HgcA [bacterium]|nr:mercury methylation corrinoid protein HgcA [bacterium]
MSDLTTPNSALVHNGFEIPRTASELTFADTLGSWKARWGIGRMNYVVAPGLYASGEPTSHSPVFVSANYKMSFDRLRSSLKGRNGWILVLDTKGINVWCAAGKGTFGTSELVNRIRITKLHEVVDHRMLIVPQLGAVGVSAHIVKKLSGFRVKFGPVRAKDIPAFLDAGLSAMPEMREVRFPLMDRLVLAPMEIVGGAKYILIAIIVFFLLSGIGKFGFSTDEMMHSGISSAVNLLVIYLTAAILGPVLLPWLPGRAFSLKGFWIGLAVGILIIFSSRIVNVNTAGWALIAMSSASFMVMNFTGSSTFTSLSGVRREMKVAVPLQIIGEVLGFGLWIAGRFM